ncbi:hypothetical protein [Myroides fluvii]|uniref:hypothetical protein n=1 Tax=Myroides fluvii TaxID=2572594 RepID=UPI00131D601D|nr:hypothetical protein [Myroides fluvii]
MNFEMKRYKVLYYLVLAIFFSLTTVHGQHLGAKLTDNSVSTTNTEVLPFSLLDLSSAERGFLLPRLTTEERRNIPQADLQQGLMIYNTTIDCMEFYNQGRNRWLNLCGEIEPATFVIPDSKCSKIQIEGNYFEGVFLKERAHIIFLEVSVSTPGTYQVEATAYNGGNPNGYTFQGSGIFPEAGNYHIVLRGTGTPIEGYTRDGNGAPTSQGDTIKFVLNGKESTCTIYNFVEKESLKYKIDRIDPIEKFYIGVPLTNARSGKLVATLVNITMGGTVEINTLDNNGIRFSGRHVLTNSEIAAGTVQVILKGEGTPAVPRNTPLEFFTNSHVQVELGQSPDSFPYTVSIEPLDLEFYCNNTGLPSISHEGVYEYFTALTADNKIHVPLKVLAPGRGIVTGVVEATTGSIYDNQVEQIEFESPLTDFVFNDLRDDVQNVILVPKEGTGKPTVGDKNIVVRLKVTSRGAHEYDSSYPKEAITITGCDYEIPVKVGNSAISLTCNTISVAGDYFVRVPLHANNFLSTTVVVSKPGKWSITTNTVDGISFSGSGVFKTPGTHTVKLMGTGTPTAMGIKSMQLTVESNANATTCDVRVKVMYRSKRVLALGLRNTYGYTFAQYGATDTGSYKLIYSPGNFGTLDSSTILYQGWTEVIQGGNAGIASENVFRSWLGLDGSKPVDIVVLGYDTYISVNKAAMLKQYLDNGGVLLAYCDRADDQSSNNLLRAVFNNSINTVYSGGAGTVYPFNTNNNPLLNGPFGDIRGKYWGEDASTTASVPAGQLSNVDVLSSDSRNNAVIFKHKTLNFIWVGDGGFNSNNASNGAGSTICPLKVDGNGQPIARTAYGSSRTDVYNAVFTANAFAWAIEQADKR